MAGQAKREEGVGGLFAFFGIIAAVVATITILGQIATIRALRAENAFLHAQINGPTAATPDRPPMDSDGPGVADAPQ